MHSYDVAIIGGGLVGASMARSLSGSGLRTVVLDQQVSSALYAAQLDNRGLALSHGSKTILEKINVWSKLNQDAYPISNVHISEQGGFGFTRLSANNFNIPALGYVVSASKLGLSLLQGLEDLADITVHRPVTIKGLCFNSAQTDWTICLDEQKITAKLLIAADGTDSFLRTRQNIQSLSIDFQQSAIVTNVYISNNSVNLIDTAFERFTASGVVALLPFGKQRYKCIWTVGNTDLPRLMQLNEPEFINLLQDAIGYRLGELSSIDKRIAFPIRQLQAKKLFTEGAVLIGNAANTLHPVAAQGFNLGLRDVIELSNILRIAQRDKLSINTRSVLEQYAQQRAADHRATQNNTNTLVNLFSSDKLFSKTKRRLGIVTAHLIRSINRSIAARGAGIWTS